VALAEALPLLFNDRVSHIGSLVCAGTALVSAMMFLDLSAAANNLQSELSDANKESKPGTPS
jgi:hypothetical protein